MKRMDPKYFLMFWYFPCFVSELQQRCWTEVEHGAMSLLLCYYVTETNLFQIQTLIILSRAGDSVQIEKIEYQIGTTDNGHGWRKHTSRQLTVITFSKTFIVENLNEQIHKYLINNVKKRNFTQFSAPQASHAKTRLLLDGKLRNDHNKNIGSNVQ